MKFGSVCSGIEAASVAWGPLGWGAAWLSEIEAFPSAVLAHHYPGVPNLGDMTALPARVRSGEIEAPDVFCGGTPCQAFSVAGPRRSLDDARGNLSLIFCEVANEIDIRRADAGKPAAVVFWENVPGVLSTKDNAFGCFLAGLAGETAALIPPGRKWEDAGCVFGPQRTVAWRVLDAQYFGLAQRRRRVFVVASARDGFDPIAVLFEFEGARRDTAPSRETRQDATHDIAPCLTSSGRGVERTGDTRGQDPVVAVRRVPVAFGGNNQSGPIDVATARNACASASGRMDFETETFVVQPPALSVALRGRDGGATAELGDDLSVCLRASGGGGDKAHVLAPVPILEVGKRTGVSTTDKRAGLGIGAAGDPMYTLQAGAQHGVVAPIAFDSRQDPVSSEHLFGALGSSRPQAQAVAFSIHENQRAEMAVRRLTPVECERLQGFPDGYTFIPSWNGWRKMDASETPESCRAEGLELRQNKKTGRWRVKDVDGPRYKALGNSWAVPVVAWIGQRIADALAKPQQDIFG